MRVRRRSPLHQIVREGAPMLVGVNYVKGEFLSKRTYWILTVLRGKTQHHLSFLVPTSLCGYLLVCVAWWCSGCGVGLAIDSRGCFTYKLFTRMTHSYRVL